ncbi:MAG: GNAT family N-acetyltransferase [Cyanobacteria bacterium NC_groundwater_1444_Ag_S-0.65um_54_12]|nr:GNAT family N-acetyltransferase [Cyanobacteria bacterium NC_groundwater_1444_Ag_S-0.65um_54_12]
MKQTSGMRLVDPDAVAFTEVLTKVNKQHCATSALSYRLAGVSFGFRVDVPEGAGIIGLCCRHGYLAGEPVLLGILRDLAVTPQARSQGLAHSLIEAAVAKASQQGAQLLLFETAGASLPLNALSAGWDQVPPFRAVGTFSSVQVVPVLWRWEEPEYRIFKATVHDIPALAYLLDLYRRTLTFGAPVTEESFRESLAKLPDFGPGDFRIARYKGEMVAMLGVWEPGPSLSIKLEAPSLLEHLIGGAGRILGRLSPFPRLPVAGQPLRARFLRYFATKQGHPQVLRYLLNRIANETRKAGAHSYQISLPQGEPWQELVRGGMRRVSYRTVWAASLAADIGVDGSGPIDPDILDLVPFTGASK